MSEFREVVHEWARRQLANRSGHTGPYTIGHTSLEETDGYYSDSTFDPSEVWISIQFTHDAGACERCISDLASRREGNKKNGFPEGSWVPHDTQHWSMMETRTTVEIVNELLAIADAV